MAQTQDPAAPARVPEQPGPITLPPTVRAGIAPTRPIEREAMLRSAAQVREVLPGLTNGRTFWPSPACWGDQVIYFLMLDRFSDGKETDYLDNEGKRVMVPGGTPRFDPLRDAGTDTNPARRDAGRTWCGGTLRGAASKLGYLKRMGVTALWVSPVFKQCAGCDSYHGYAIQNFLDVDPHFAPPGADARQELRDFVREAHRNGIYVLLDIVLNHTADVFEYKPDRYWNDAGEGRGYFEIRWDGREYPVLGFKGRDGKAIPSVDPNQPLGPVADDHFPDGAVWPAELQSMDAFSRQGEIRNWDWYPEYLNGDFYSLKNVNMGAGGVADFRASPALVALTDCYKYWIAYADIDGFRIDTVKHIEPGAARYFASTIHEFAQRIGKENFYLIGEITGGRQFAFHRLEETGIDAALGIDEIPSRLEQLILGTCEPDAYFSLFRNSLLVNKDSQQWFNDKVVTMYNDHDMVGRTQARLCAYYPDRKSAERIALMALAVNVTTMGIPCIYYGSEQCFNGGPGGDEQLREAMFGGKFGSFKSAGRHFFDEDAWVYRKLGELVALRRDIVALRRGRQYLREISGVESPSGADDFGLPTGYTGPVWSIIAWSRVFDDQEILVAINTSLKETITKWVTVDGTLTVAGDRFTCIYDNLCPGTTGLNCPDKSQAVIALPSGRKVIRLTMERGGLLVFASRTAIDSARVAEKKAFSVGDVR